MTTCSQMTISQNYKLMPFLNPNELKPFNTPSNDPYFDLCNRIQTLFKSGTFPPFVWEKNQVIALKQRLRSASHHELTSMVSYFSGIERPKYSLYLSCEALQQIEEQILEDIKQIFQCIITPPEPILNPSDFTSLPNSLIRIVNDYATSDFLNYFALDLHNSPPPSCLRTKAWIARFSQLNRGIIQHLEPLNKEVDQLVGVYLIAIDSQDIATQEEIHKILVALANHRPFALRVIAEQQTGIYAQNSFENLLKILMLQVHELKNEQSSHPSETPKGTKRLGSYEKKGKALKRRKIEPIA